MHTEIHRSDDISSGAETRCDDQNGQVKQPTGKLLDSLKKALFVVGSFFIIFIAARNSVVWYVQMIWGAYGSFWQSLWETVYNLFGRNDIITGTFGTFLLIFVVFWGANAFLLLLDTTGKPSVLLRYKIQQDMNVPVNKEKLKKTVKVVLFNQIVIGIPYNYLIAVAALKRNGGTFDAPLPTFPWVLFEILIFTLIEELGFYYSHRLFHHPKLYRPIHKWHHEWTAPIGVLGMYGHPIEHIVCNLTPVALGPLLMGSHLTSSWLWYMLALLSTIISHSGYHFPGLPSPEAHDFHHMKFTQNFGVLGVLDRLHGTDNQFRASVAYKRHLLLLSWTPMSEQFPDCKNRKGK